MKCIKCGSEYPSSYYFEVQGVCKECFSKLPDEEKKDLQDLEVYYHPAEYSAYPGRVGFGLRFAAHVIDLIIVLIIFMFVSVFTGAFDAIVEMVNSVGILAIMTDPELAKEYEELIISSNISLLSIFVMLAYRISEVLLATTPGKLLFGLRITNSDGTRADYKTLWKRFIVKQSDIFFTLLGMLIAISIFGVLSSLAALTVIIGCFFVLNEKKQAFHDMYADTAVFKKEDIRETVQE